MTSRSCAKLQVLLDIAGIAHRCLHCQQGIGKGCRPASCKAPETAGLSKTGCHQACSAWKHTCICTASTSALWLSAALCVLTLSASSSALMLASFVVAS